MQSHPDTVPQDPPTSAMPGRAELVALTAMLAATVAFSVDAMLPALPAMAADLSPDAPNKVQLVVVIFVLGMGVGTLFAGPLSDAFGRKTVVLAGAAIYALAAATAAQAQSLEVLLGARLVQGLGAAAPRVVALAIIRDLHSGRQMAQMMSLVMIVFTLVPAIAPGVGALLIGFAGWPAIFWAFVLFAGISSLWLGLRLPETLPRAARRPLRARTLAVTLREMLTHPVVRLSILVQALVFGMLFATVSSIQPIYDLTFGRAESFPLWFAATAVLSASGSVLNALLVVRLGMRRLVTLMLLAQVGISGTLVALQMAGLTGAPLFPVFFLWQVGAFFQLALTIGNLNAIAMEPMGHVAGMAASVIGFLGTVAGALLAVPVGLMFDGTPLPLTAGVLVFALVATGLMQVMRRAEAALDG